MIDRTDQLTARIKPRLHHGAVRGLACDFDRVEGLGQGAELVDLDQDRVRDRSEMEISRRVVQPASRSFVSRNE